MKTWLTILRLEMHNTVRGFIPNTWLRRTILAVVAGLALSATLVGLLAPLPAGRTVPPLGMITGFVIMNLGLSVSFAVAGVAKLFREPQRAHVLMMAPVAPEQAVWIRLAPAVLLSWVPMTLLYMPFLMVFFRLAPETGAIVLVLGLAVTLWSLQLALWAVLGLVDKMGRENGLRTAYALTFVFAFASIISMGLLLQMATGPIPLLLFLALTVGFLPPLLSRTSKAFMAALMQVEAPVQVQDPVWGSLSPWRIVKRTPALWGIVGTFLMLGLFSFANAPLQAGVSAMLLYILATTPLGHAFAPEYEQPDRLRLAPFAAQVQRTLIVQVGLPVLLLAAGLALWIGWGAWGWVAGVLVLNLLGLLSYTIFAKLPRNVLQMILLAATLATQALV